MRSKFARSVLVLALALGVSRARAADPGTYVPPKKPATTAPAAPAAPAKAPPVLSDQHRVSREKRTFMDAADLCVRKETCDPELLKNAEKKFVAACEMCAPIVDCETEREAILAGKATKKSNPCTLAAAAKAAEKPGSKEKGSSAAAAMAARKAAAEKSSQKAAQAKGKPAPQKPAQ